ncbi:MAG: glycosyltransferase family 4 protein [Luteibaculum sp.]
MKVALLNTYLSGGGAAIACQRLFHALYKDGSVEYVKIIADTGKQVPNKAPQEFKYFNYSKYFLERYWVKKMESEQEFKSLFSPAFLGSPGLRTKQFKPFQLLHLHWINHGFLNLKNLRQLAQLKKPIVWTLHDMWAFTGGCHHSIHCNNFQQECGNCFYLKNPGEKDYSHKLWSKKAQLYPKLNLTVVSPSNWLANKARESSLFKNLRVEVIPNPIDTELFKPLEPEKKVSHLALDPEKITLSFIAANISNPFKGISYLKESLDLLASENPHWVDKVQLLIVGKPDKQISWPFPTVFAGFISDEAEMVSMYQSSDIFMLPSVQDNLPNTVMEALACGTPVVAFNTGGVPDMVNSEVGYLAKYKDPADFAKGLLELIQNPEKRAEAGKQARDQVLKKFSYPIVAQQYAKLYQEILSQA